MEHTDFAKCELEDLYTLGSVKLVTVKMSQKHLLTSMSNILLIHLIYCWLILNADEKSQVHQIFGYNKECYITQRRSNGKQPYVDFLYGI